MAATKKLLIVESPAKAKTIKKILGRNFTVKASVGHIRDLKSSGRGKKALGIDVDNNYTPDYTVIKGKEKTVKELKEAAAKADEVYLAPDPDREGEAIAWHLKEIIGLSEEDAHRVTYSSITKKAVLQGIENPRKIDMNLVNAQQGRRILDRLVGFSLSPFLWKKVAKNLSAGRVQSVAVRIVVEREREIKAFDPQEYWKIKALVSPEKQKETFDAQLVRFDGEKFELGNAIASTEASSKEVADHINEQKLSVAKIVTKETKGRPSPPFITSTMQQAASSALSFGTSKTMSVAQKLYEGMEIDGVTQGLITYMRTDSVRVAPEAIEEVRNYISNNYPPEYLTKDAQNYSAKKNAQDAHEAIRPSSVELTPEKVAPYLTKEQLKLYELIWRRFVASQLPPAIFDITTLTINAGKAEFEAKGRIIRFKGHTIVLPEAKAGKEDGKYQNIPDVKEGDAIDLHELDVTQNFTKPPSRFSEASLVRALEKEGIGRPSTYAPIIKTIRDRGYTRLENRAFHATELGMAVNDILIQNFDDIMEFQFTAGMESGLDEVEAGSKDWVQLIDDFYKPFDQKLEKALAEAEPLKGRPWDGDEKCPLCGKGLTVRYSVNGAFLGCEAYPECKGLIPMPGERDDDDPALVEVNVDCPTCSSPMLMKTSRYGKQFLACTKYPECKTTMSVDKEGKPVELPKIKMDCDVCGKPMEVKMGRRGAFLACSAYPDCKNTMPIDKDGNPIILPKVEGEVCEKCGKPMDVKMGRRGPFLACTGYPKCKNAKPLPGEEGAKKDDKKDEKKEEETKSTESTES